MVTTQATTPSTTSSTPSQARPIGWQLLIAVSVGVMLFGLAMLVLDDAIQTLFNLILFSSPDYPADFSPDAIAYIRLTIGIAGAVMVGWMITVVYLALNWRNNPTMTWSVIGLSVGVWYVLDSGYSAYLGFYQNVALNTVFLASFAIPMLLILRNLRQQSSTA